jgi:ribonuclease HI
MVNIIGYVVRGEYICIPIYPQVEFLDNDFKRTKITYIVYFDGACEPVNPGGTASYGAVIFYKGKQVWQCSKVYGRGKGMSNNVAEYAGFITVLNWFAEQELFDAEIRILGDSKLVIQQMFGSWKIKDGLYAPLAQNARERLSQFKKVTGEWVPRDLNDIADKLSKDALKQAGVKLMIQPERGAK